VEDDGNLVPVTMTDDCIVQTWFRFLHTVGNPVELTQPTTISQTQNFLQVLLLVLEKYGLCFIIIMYFSMRLQVKL
jgi:hypothetical protein